MTEEDKVPQRLTQAYRELEAAEPPRALDEAILAAARRPALPWTRRWAVPLSLAAVLVLSVTVTLRMQHEQPGVEVPTQVAKQTVPASPAPAASAAPPAAEAELKLKAEDQLKQGAAAPARDRPAKTAKGERPREPQPEPFADQRRNQVAAAPTAPAEPPAPAAAPALSSRADALRSAESSVSGGAARQTEERTARDAEAAARAPQVGAVIQPLQKRAELGAKAAVESPERELERIAQLRREGRHEEADRALTAFRKRLPDYRIPDAMLERVERR